MEPFKPISGFRSGLHSGRGFGYTDGMTTDPPYQQKYSPITILRNLLETHAARQRCFLCPGDRIHPLDPPTQLAPSVFRPAYGSLNTGYVKLCRHSDGIPEAVGTVTQYGPTPCREGCYAVPISGREAEQLRVTLPRA